MSLKQIMGSAYHENLTLQEIDAFFENNSKIVNLSDGKYVDKGKYDTLNQTYQSLLDSTKDYEDIKGKYNTLIEKQTKDGELAIINKYVQPDFSEFVHFQLKNNNKLGDKLEDNVKEFLKSNNAYAIPKAKEPKTKVVSTYVKDENVGSNQKTPSQNLNNAIRIALGRNVEE